MESSESTLRMIRDAAEQFATFDGERVRSLRATEPGFDRALWRGMADQGWLTILLDESAGGFGLGFDAAAVVARALGAAAAPEPFVAAGIMAPALLADCEGARQYLEQVARGELVACLAWQAIDGSLDITRNTIVASAVGNGVTLSGECRFVPIAHADAYIVFASQGDGQGLFWVPAGAAGLTTRVERHADGTASAWLSLCSTLPSSARLLAGPDPARAALRRAVDVGIVANCAELMGVMDRMLALTLDYLRTRRQFDRAIGSFQALQHRAVDLWMHKEVADHATAAAVRTVGAAKTPEISRAISASSAKARVGEVAMKFANETVQLHGAIGFTDEYDLGLYVNRVLTLAPFLGNAAEHRARYGALKQCAGALG